MINDCNRVFRDSSLREDDLIDNEDMLSATKRSEASKTEYNHNNFVVNDNTNNEVSINVFKSNNIEKSGKIYGTSRRKISLKDFIFFLENEMNVPLKMLLLQKAEIRISKLNHNNH